LKKTTYIKWYT